jgi:hypothetical protein
MRNHITVELANRLVHHGMLWFFYLCLWAITFLGVDAISPLR